MSAANIPVLQKAIDSIEWIASQPVQPSAREVGEALHIAPTTCYRILQVFLQRGWLRATDGGRFATGWGLLPVCQSLTSHPFLGAEAGEILDALARSVGHAAKLSLREGNDSVTLRRAEAPVAYGLAVRPGSRFSVVVGASGAMLLAKCTDEEVALAVAAAPADAWTYQTKRQLAGRIAASRAAGWCRDDGSYRPDVFGLSVPLNPMGLGSQAALSLIGLAHGLSARAVESWVKPLKKRPPTWNGWGDDPHGLLTRRADRSWQLAKQIGITHAICKCAPELTGLPAPDDLPTLRAIRDRFAEEGITLHGLEGDQFDMQRIKLGLPGRDADIARYQRMLRNMGELGIGLLCYNFMATIGWYRTDPRVPGRGGATTNRFRQSAVDPEPVARELRITEDALWANYAYFLERVLPVAESAGVVMGLHPDDPPVSPLRGVGRILTSADAFTRAMSLSDSPSHRVTFCQATFRAMGEDVERTARRFADRIAFVHFRDVRGTRDDFTETFHDEGPTDMPAMLKLYDALGFRGPIRVDHVPSMAGEDDLPHGYAQLGRLFAVGYMKGILDAYHIAHV